MKLLAAILCGIVAALPNDQTTLIEPSTSKHPAQDAPPLLGFGTWNLDKSNASEAVSLAIQTGYRHIDCAAIYGNEAEVGRGIKDGLLKANLTRQDLWITSKLWNDHHGLNSAESAIDSSIHNLGVGYLDLYLMHWPVAFTSIIGSRKIEYRDTWGAMGLLLEKGKARRIGISNFDPKQLKDLLKHGAHKPSVHQMEMHPYLQQNDWLKFHENHGIHVTAYSPLGGTNPTYNGEKNPKPLLNQIVVKSIAKHRDCSPAQVLISWGMHRKTSVIPKTQRADRIEENFHSASCKLSAKDVAKIDDLGHKHWRYNNPAESWGLKGELYQDLEDAKGKHKKHS